MERIGILGAGTWGMALARMLYYTGKEVTVWSAFSEEIEERKKTNRCPKLPKMELPKGIVYTTSMEEVCRKKQVILFAVPSVFVRNTAKMASPFIEDGQVIVDVAKGIETETLMTLSEVIRDEIKKDTVHFAVLSGPTHAEEVAMNMPTTIVSACEEIEVAKYVQEFFCSFFMRAYVNTDVKGIEICGALKNIIALATGISSGLGYGDNAKAALITRGLAEMTRLGMKLGCSPETFCGLTGMGDLIVTCTSKHSRNNRAGYLIGQGKTPDEARAEIGMVVEGIYAILPAVKLAEKYEVEMPIITAVHEIIYGGREPLQVVNELLHRKLKSEFM